MPTGSNYDDIFLGSRRSFAMLFIKETTIKSKQLSVSFAMTMPTPYTNPTPETVD